MKFLLLSAAVASTMIAVQPNNQCSAFVVAPSVVSSLQTMSSQTMSSQTMSSKQTSTSQQKTTQSQLNMGLFDMFSSDAKEERERRKKIAADEQERLQKEIIDRRRNPQKMEEYELKTQQRRELRMKGEDDKAVEIGDTIYSKKTKSE
jgi:hypothetical protein